VSGKQLRSYVKTCLRFGDATNANDEMKQITNRGTDKLTALRRQSPDEKYKYL